MNTHEIITAIGIAFAVGYIFGSSKDGLLNLFAVAIGFLSFVSLIVAITLRFSS